MRFCTATWISVIWNRDQNKPYLTCCRLLTFCWLCIIIFNWSGLICHLFPYDEATHDLKFSYFLTVLSRFFRSDDIIITYHVILLPLTQTCFFLSLSHSTIFAWKRKDALAPHCSHTLSHGFPLFLVKVGTGRFFVYFKPAPRRAVFHIRLFPGRFTGISLPTYNFKDPFLGYRTWGVLIFSPTYIPLCLFFGHLTFILQGNRCFILVFEAILFQVFRQTSFVRCLVLARYNTSFFCLLCFFLFKVNHVDRN